jgi:predicted TPR repeat methyltransferase
VTLAEQLETKPGWLAQGFYELADSERSLGKHAEAVQHYRRFLGLAKSDSPYRIDAIKQLGALGSPYER